MSTTDLRGREYQGANTICEGCHTAVAKWAVTPDLTAHALGSFKKSNPGKPFMAACSNCADAEGAR